MNKLITKNEMKASVSPVLDSIQGMTIPAGTTVKRGAYKWNNDTFFISDFSWIPEEIKSNFFMGDLANYGINVPESNVTMEIEVTYEGIDYWNRPIFRDSKYNYYSSVNMLYSHDKWIAEQDKEKVLNDLTYHGGSFDSEPMGSTVNAKFKLVQEF